MSQRKLITIVVVLLLPEVSLCFRNQSKESELIHELLENYNLLARPVLNSSDILDVDLSFNLLKILHVNEKVQMITTNIWLHLLWNDSYLTWDPKNYNNIKSVRIPISRIWHPDITHYNAVEGEQLSCSEAKNAVVSSNGNVIYVPSMVLKSGCLMDITWFPFDEQNCQVDFGSWTYSGFELDIKVNPIVDVGGYVKNGEWNLLETTSSREMKFYDCCEEPYVTTKFSIRIKRKSLYYFFNLIVPGTLIGFLAILGFTLPPDSGEKLSLGVTVLFSLIMFLNIISQSMPANADKIPLLGTYFTCIMFTIASSVISTIVINLSHRTFGVPAEIKGKCRSILLERIPRFLRMEPLKQSNIKPKVIELSNDVQQQEVDYFLDEKSLSSKNRILQEWKFLAYVVDRICLISSLVFTLVAGVVLLISSIM